MLATLRCVVGVLTAPFDGQGGQGRARQNAWQSLLTCASSRTDDDTASTTDGPATAGTVTTRPAGSV